MFRLYMWVVKWTFWAAGWTNLCPKKTKKDASLLLLQRIKLFKSIKKLSVFQNTLKIYIRISHWCNSHRTRYWFARWVSSLLPWVKIYLYHTWIYIYTLFYQINLRRCGVHFCMQNLHSLLYFNFFSRAFFTRVTFDKQHLHTILQIYNMQLFTLILQAIGSPDATEQIVRSLLFYTVTNLEAFIFCFAGEYLKNKVKDRIFLTIMYNRL